MAEKNSSTVLQQSRITDEEKQLLKSHFLDNEDLLVALRNLMFGFRLQALENSLLKQLQVEPIKVLLRKIFLPELGPTIPIGQSVDLWMTVKLDVPERDKTHIKARQLLIDNLETALATLDTLDNSGVSLKVEKTPEGLMNRNTYISHIEVQLQAIRAMANAKQETEEERIQRLAKDSLK